MESRQFGTLGVYVFIVGVYTGIHYPLGPGNAYVPYVVSALGFLLVLIQQVGRGRFLKRGVCPVVVIVFTALSISLLRDSGEWYAERIKFCLQLGYSVGASFVVASELVRWSPRRMSFLSGVFWVSVVTLSIWEIAVGGGGIFEEFRRVAFYGEAATNVARDVELHGGLVRPHPFSLEPSHSGLFTVIISALWLATSRGKRRYLMYFLGSVATIVVLRSPVLILLIVNGAVIFGWRERKAIRRFQRIGPVRMIVVVSLGLVCAATVAVTMRPRLELVVRGTDPSFQERFVEPLRLAEGSLSDSPMFGSGLGAEQSTVANSGLRVYRVVGNGEGYLMNSLVGNWAYLGVIGGSIVLAGLVSLCLSWKASLIVSLMLMFECLMLVGSYVGMRLWAFLFFCVIIGVAVAREKEQSSAFYTVGR